MQGMRIVMIYPPPWKIAAPGDPLYPPGEGPPKGREGMVLDGDFIEAPYGTLSLAAQAKKAGHDVIALNLSIFPWKEVERIIAKLDADLFGMTVFTANRRGMAFLADLIRRLHPRAHISVGGPHPTALPREILEHYPAIDTCAMGEGEETFMEMISRLEKKQPVRDMPGLAWREEGGVKVGGTVSRRKILDYFADLHEYYTSAFLITSRGCPGRCTYCGSNGMWGLKLYFHSVEYVLEMIERTVVRDRMPMIAIKDDTFTANRKRGTELCDEIVRRGYKFIWSCDTRVDMLDESVLRSMRRAGCQKLSLGIETASPAILKNIRKRITPQKILKATAEARKFGFMIRFYMMIGNRGETKESLQESMDLIYKARPNSAVWTPLSIYPGTEEFRIFQEEFGGDTEFFFTSDFWKPTKFPDATPEVEEDLYQFANNHRGIESISPYTVEELRSVTGELPDLHAVWMDLGGALLEAGKLEEAERCVTKAMEMGYPLASIGQNYLACIERERGNIDEAREWLCKAARGYPQEYIMTNAIRFDDWESAGREGPLPRFFSQPEFELAVERRQPANPGPIDIDNLGFEGTRQSVSA